MDNLLELIQQQCCELSPRPVALSPMLKSLPGIRAVLFDVYGTMLISASGDIGTDSQTEKQKVFADLAAQHGLRLKYPAEQAIVAFESAIRADHERSRARGVQYPEVEIREIWRDTLSELLADGADTVAIDRFAIEFESRVNPTWPMPGLLPTLEGLRNAGHALGIVSNAQFFTPLLFPALVGQSLESLGFDAKLSYFSYEARQAKPGVHLYERAAESLRSRGIQASEVLYVGNDMLNDVTASAAVGFRTALFAGDQRSLRLRSDDSRVNGVVADIIVTALPQLLQCVIT